MKNRASRNGFTLAELIAAIALLAVFSVFIVQMFARSDQLARKARGLDQAVVCASNLADQWRTDLTEDVPAEIIDLRTNPAAGRTAIINLDTHFLVCEPAQAYYHAVLTLEAAAPADPEAPAGVWQLNIVIGRIKPSDSAPVYTLKTSRYNPGEVAAP